MRVFASVAILTATLVGFATPSLAAGVSTGDANASRATSGSTARDGSRVAASCAWVYREKLCQTEWGRRKYPGCC
jgi:hypothetical protein